MNKKRSLKDAFAEDQQTLTRGLSQLVKLAEEGNFAEPTRVALELDAAAFDEELLLSGGREHARSVAGGGQRQRR